MIGAYLYMSWLENMLIMAGILLDVFAAMEIQGAMLANIKKKTLVIACIVVAAVEPNIKYPDRAVYKFEDTAELRKAIQPLINRK